jgi:type VI protein secretion system component VasK
MSDKTLMFLAMMTAVLLICAALVLWRLRRWSAARAEAERRAVTAFEEMQRVTKSLREEVRVAEDATPPGERLKQRYPGVRRRPAVAGE